MSAHDETAPREWQLFHPNEFSQSNKRVLGTQNEEIINANVTKEIILTMTLTSKPRFKQLQKKLINAIVSKINNNDSKKVSFKVSEANAEAWDEEAMKKTNKKNGSAGTTTMQEIMKEVHVEPQGIKVTINGKKTSKSQKE